MFLCIYSTNISSISTSEFPIGMVKFFFSFYTNNNAKTNTCCVIVDQIAYLDTPYNTSTAYYIKTVS